MKICTQCKIEKPLGAFTKASKASGCRLGVRAACKVCTRLKEKASQAADPGKNARRLAALNAGHKRDRKENPKKYREFYLKRDKLKKLAQARAWYARNREAQRTRSLRWHAENPARARMNVMKHVTSKMLATPAWLTRIHDAQIQEMYDIAVARNMQTGIKHHVDHIFPLRGTGFRGLHVPWNLQVITAEKNTAKKNKVPAEHADLFWKAA